ncbi:MAG: hypothetical protein ACI4A8_03660 [Muribaculaceae bacterium]
MNDFNNIGRRMPFIEGKDYVDRLIDRCAASAPAEAARRNARASVLRRAIISVSAAAACFAAVICSGSLFDKAAQPAFADATPIDELLATMSAEQLEALDQYYVEVPEY